MRILIAEDEAVSRLILEETLKSWGHEVVVTGDGEEAWKILARDDAPEAAVLDWSMPKMDGLEICRRLASLERSEPTYVILLTSRRMKSEIAEGLNSGANDYIIKPFDRDELRARVRVAQRVTALQSSLALRVRELSDALSRVRRLETMLPVCSYCRQVRNDKNYWQTVEAYFEERAEIQFSHGICPDCFQRVAAELDPPDPEKSPSAS